jgi:hypothetical protein
MRYDIERFILAVMPLILAAFCILAISIICENRWVLVLLQIPVWVAVIWWMWMDARERYL